jgi:hypothetical protein
VRSQQRERVWGARLYSFSCDFGLRGSLEPRRWENQKECCSYPDVPPPQAPREWPRLETVSPHRGIVLIGC